jgi:hypothetical protein
MKLNDLQKAAANARKNLQFAECTVEDLQQKAKAARAKSEQARLYWNGLEALPLAARRDRFCPVHWDLQAKKRPPALDMSSIVALLLLYCSSIVPLLLVVSRGLDGRGYSDLPALAAWARRRHSW